ncbi:TcfC E-set like domain-containing protein [Vibrio sp. Makdt]|uniref:CS1-pili formation C-terminal domain-containing protein n=1 Tax=Vibrio sp. Makdt TaxID=2998828 RepID=UPI0022CD2749|nr:TcfC E-set like domain-containing protein [Vibrio sp. Makdt]MDA0153624.1 TcfC E-set like domain-containing protein [Vibrio sp. Makdt]
MKNSTFITTTILGSLTLSHLVFANGNTSIPAGFEDFYSQQERDVELKNIDGRYMTIPMSVTYDSVQFSNPDDATAVAKELMSSGLNERSAKQIVAGFSRGQSNTVDCQGDLNLCSLTPKTYDTFYDYHSNKLYLYVNKELLEKSKPKALKKHYASTYNANPGLINNASLYTSSDFTNNLNVNLSDQFILGLPYGSVHVDTYLSNQEDASELNYGYYNLEYQNLRLTAGYHQDRLALNSTSFLLNSTQYHDVNVNLSSSKNLSRTAKNEDQSLYFYAQTQGVLKIFRDDQIILQQSVQEGQGSISYSQLPDGVYDVIVEISVGNQVVSSESVRIYNANTDTLNTGEFDYSVTVGQFQDNDTYQSDESQLSGLSTTNEFEGVAFLQGALAYKWSDAQTVAVSSTLTNDHAMGQLGLKGYLPFDSRYEVFLSNIDSEAWYLSGYWNLGTLGFTYERLNNPKQNQFAQHLYGVSDKEQLGMSTSYSIGDMIRGYSSVNYIEQNTLSNSQFSNWSISSGLSTPFIVDSTLDLNVTINNEQLTSNWDDGELSISLNWSVPLSSKLTGNTGVTITENGFSQYTNSLETQDLVKDQDTDLRLTASNSYYVNSPNAAVTNVTAYAAKRDEHYQADGFVYASNNGEKALNATLRSTQIIGGESVNFTTAQSDAYVVVDTQNNIRFDTDEKKTKGLVVVRADDQVMNKQYIYNDRAVITLDDYQAATIELDVESVALHNTGQQSVTGYTHPGSVIELNSNVSRVISFVSKFKDIFGNNVHNIECEGPACLNVSSITSGIHKVDVQEGQQFALTSNGQQCYLPSVDDAKQLNFGTNFCQPNLNPMESMMLVSNNKEINVMYIGEFDDINTLNEQLHALTDSGMEFITTRLGRTSFVYLTVNKDLQLSHQQRQHIENVARYANSESLREHNFVLNRPEGN